MCERPRGGPRFEIAVAYVNWPETLDRMGTGGGECTELERRLGDLSAVGRTVCAFANTDGGVIVLGVTDSRPGKVSVRQRMLRRAVRHRHRFRPQ